MRFFDEVKFFEIGKVFCRDAKQRISANAENISEKLKLGIALASKNNPPFAHSGGGGGKIFFELKGVIEQLFKKIGLVDFSMNPVRSQTPLVSVDAQAHRTSNGVKESKSGLELEIESENKIIGSISYLNNNGALAEIDLESLLKLVVEEHEYRPLPKYPSIMRDISILAEPRARVGEITQAIQEVDLKYIEDVDLIDEYELENKRSLTFRIIFQAEDRTLIDDEVNKKMDEISETLKNKFKAVIR